MADRKTATLMLRLCPEIKEDLRALAARERRSLSNMVEVMILEYSQQHGIAVLEVSPDVAKKHADSP
ncbi:MAG: hypothetical protein H6953_18400 [Chromatiaceae bacterium]|jgi:hypothetical protein|nr:hypothetical protein [Candidatus Competibacteraceae bacterium]MCB1966171.1 hypothetical protein [Accumulibacter sp.]MCP5307388.1 hypothetical protein [Chromatiaceae bacterium]